MSDALDKEPERQSELVETQETDGLTARLRALIGRVPEPREIPRRVHVIINPAAGKDQPILKTMNAAMKTAGVDWDVSITKEAGDARRFALQALQDGVDTIIVHGGDGTVMEAASALVGSNIPLAVIPGGTANVLALELGIPFDLVESFALAVNPRSTTRHIDIGQVEDHYFLIRASIGLEAAMVEGADREKKDRMGVFAYALAALQALAEPTVARYRLVIDGQEVDTQGMTCIIANSGTMGLRGVTLSPQINISDGKLDVAVVTNADLPHLVALAASVVTGSDQPPSLQVWQASEVTVYSDPLQSVQVDGEILTQTPFTARVIPGAVHILVPPVQT